jgi:hypothetical protein
MINISGVISGLLITTVGIVMMTLTIIISETPRIILIPYSIILISIGFYMIINNKKEDEIERIR